jgi:hypothetical protein
VHHNLPFRAKHNTRRCPEYHLPKTKENKELWDGALKMSHNLLQAKCCYITRLILLNLYSVGALINEHKSLVELEWQGKTEILCTVTCPRATLFSINRKLTGLEPNPVLRGETKRQSHGTYSSFSTWGAREIQSFRVTSVLINNGGYVVFLRTPLPVLQLYIRTQHHKELRIKNLF